MVPLLAIGGTPQKRRFSLHLPCNVVQKFREGRMESMTSVMGNIEMGGIVGQGL
jgi:hypothetical protein